jgi:uncharacterized protein YlxW (UPF0749 family)
VAVTAGLAGFLFVASAGAAQGTDLRNDLGDLRSAVSAEQARLARTESAIERLSDDVLDLTSTVGAADGRTVAADAQADSLAPIAGLSPVRGEGIVVTLDDAPADPAVRARAESLDDLVVHQQDIQAVVNALWLAGAEGVMLMDQRLVTTSAVRCVGNTLSLHGTPYSPPYVVSAVGDAEAMRDALDASEPVQTYLEYVDAFGLGWSVEERDDVEVAAFTGSTVPRYAVIAG